MGDIFFLTYTIYNACENAILYIYICIHWRICSITNLSITRVKCILGCIIFVEALAAGYANDLSNLLTPSCVICGKLISKQRAVC